MKVKVIKGFYSRKGYVSNIKQSKWLSAFIPQQVEGKDFNDDSNELENFFNMISCQENF